MKLVTADMFGVIDSVDNFVITTNSTIKDNGALVMGAGIAREVRDNFPGIDLAWGEVIERVGLLLPKGLAYGIVVSKRIDIATFQVKYHYRDKADLELIAMSAVQLTKWAKLVPDETFALNYPGVGLGGLSKTEVWPLIKNLPDNVTVFQND